MLTFTQFNIEQHSNCNFDYLQIHDGPTASQHRIGKYCGTTLPNGGTINTTTHEAYLWFHSDDSIARDGFTVTWRSVIPGSLLFIIAVKFMLCYILTLKIFMVSARMSLL